MQIDNNHEIFRVPREDRSLLAIPSLDTAHQLVESNQSLFAEATCTLNGRSLSDLRSAARSHALSAARSFTSLLIQSDLATESSESLVVSGHQPELFHVGVWAKNFALSGVARRSRAVPVNLVIDNDTLNDSAIGIPLGSRDSMRVDRIRFDMPRPVQPWEEATIRDREVFQKFGSIVRDRMRQNWKFDPLAGEAWKATLATAESSDRLCDGITAARASMERTWGLNNLELPMSRLCATEPFLWFASHLLVRLPEMHAVYNQAVTEYRQIHRLRNRMQPVPDLEVQDDWLEAPFWIWRRGDFQRGRLFARRVGFCCELRDEKEMIARFRQTDDGSLADAVDVLGEFSARGLRLRTRALTTTLFARVCLADLFLHGIGGAKYDEMTDRICERFFGLPAPKFLTVSATLHLPLGESFTSTEVELQQVNHQLRDLYYNPDRHLESLNDVSALVREKAEILTAAQALRQTHQLRGQLTTEMHRRLVTIRANLQDLVRTRKEEYESKKRRIESQLAANSLLRNREYSFLLYPEDQVRGFLEPLANANFLKK